VTRGDRDAAGQLAAELVRDLGQLVRLAVLEGVLAELERRGRRPTRRARRRLRLLEKPRAAGAPRPVPETKGPVSPPAPPTEPVDLGQGDYDPDLEAW